MKKLFGLLGFLLIFLTITSTQAHTIKKSKIRDPFFLQAPEQYNRIEHQEPVLRLVGIAQSGTKIGALIKNHKRTKIVFQGDDFDGHIVEKISEKDVVLVKGKKSKTLALE